MSRCIDWGAAICPPMLNRPPPTETDPDHPRSPAHTSAVDLGRRSSATRTGLSCETSLITGSFAATRDDNGPNVARLDTAAPSMNRRRLRLAVTSVSSSAGERDVDQLHALAVARCSPGVWLTCA